ncbi:MAG: radical SAM protein [Pirellulaceae bacterium]|nr:radical SAM protein [Pirellulaceae bacterium]
MHSQTPNMCHEVSYCPRGLLLQWHVTERCNLRCAHCYQESYSGKELDFADLLMVLWQYKELLAQWRDHAKQPGMRGHITVTGGEPFVRRDFLDLLEVFAANRKRFSFAILTNGTFIDDAMARRLRKLRPAFVQVSIEGSRVTHNEIRGSGNFERTVSAIKHLVRARIRTLISFTANRLNYQEFPEVARLGRRLRVSRVWADRLIPWGIGSAMKEQVLTHAQTREFFEIMRKEHSQARWWFGRTEVAMHRSLQFLVAGGKPYHCAAGDSLITVQPNGDLYPCRRMPIRAGNLMETPLVELYYENALFRALRDRNHISDGCQGCFYSKLCRGGLKCLSYAVTGDPFRADPGCWHAIPGTQVEQAGSHL